MINHNRIPVIIRKKKGLSTYLNVNKKCLWKLDKEIYENKLAGSNWKLFTL